MGSSEIEQNLLAIGEPKLHGGMCKSLCPVYTNILAIFPDLEAARPRSTSGIQALCALHIALEKTKNVLQHCVECSKLYLAITGDSVVLKFEKARCALEDSLRQIEDIVPLFISCQIGEILRELGKIEFSLDPVEKQIGSDIIVLLQQGRNLDNTELEIFHQAASKLGITSSRAALRERRALKKLIERARTEEDKRKESIVVYLMHLMKKYSKLFRSEFSDDNDSQGSTPCSPTTPGSLKDGSVVGHNCSAFDRQLLKHNSFCFKPNAGKSEQILVAPEELRCPISLQLMYDPVIIASGQTYERVCIEKWFSDGHSTCPKTHQQLPHLSLTPNYCVKGMVTNWCEQNDISVPDSPPDSLDFNNWSLLLSKSDSENSKSLGSVKSCKVKCVKVVPLNHSGIIEETKGNEEDATSSRNGYDGSAFQRYDYLLSLLKRGDDLIKKKKVVEKIRHLLIDDEEARIYMGDNGFVAPLLSFLESAISVKNGTAQEVGSMALFNLAVNNNRNKKLLLASGLLPILQTMIADNDSMRAATALYLNLSCLEEARPVIGALEAAVSFLISVLERETEEQCKLDALETLYNISSNPANIQHLVSGGIIGGLQTLITNPNHDLAGKCIAVLICLASNRIARDEIIMSPGIITGLAYILDAGEPAEQEQAAACLLMLCIANEACSQTVLQEGVIPSLVSISVTGTARGKKKAQKLLMLFREQRQKDPPSPGLTQPMSETIEVSMPTKVSKPLCKSISRQKVAKTLIFWRKSKSFSIYHC